MKNFLTLVGGYRNVQAITKTDLIKDKLLGLELVRFVAAFAVLVWHYQHFSYLGSKEEMFSREKQPFYYALSVFYDYGYLGVHVFWCISGFIFFWKYGDTIANKALGLKKFFILRFSRLYPLHFVTLLLVVIMQKMYLNEFGSYFLYQENDLYHFILQIFLASNWGFEEGFSFNGPIWSISVEVLVYFFFFFMLRKIGNFFLLNLSVVALGLIFRLAGISSPVTDCVVFFYLGGIAASAFIFCRRRGFDFAASIIALCLLTGVTIFFGATEIYQKEYFSRIFLVMYAPMLIFIAAGRVSVPIFIERIIAAAGNMTYSSYLIHFPMQLSVALYYVKIDERIPFENSQFFVGFILMILLAAYLSYRFFEMPAQSYIRRKFNN